MKKKQKKMVSRVTRPLVDLSEEVWALCAAPPKMKKTHRKLPVILQKGGGAVMVSSRVYNDYIAALEKMRRIEMGRLNG